MQLSCSPHQQIFIPNFLPNLESKNVVSKITCRKTGLHTLEPRLQREMASRSNWQAGQTPLLVLLAIQVLDS
jgi:hypothetical protein